MSFPASPLSIAVDIAPGADLTADPATWTFAEVSEYARYAAGVTIRYGREDEFSQVDSGTCRLTLDNTGGRFSPQCATGPWYGSLGKNTPLRVVVTPDGLLDTFGRTVASGWGTADSGQSWTCSGGVASDHSVAGGVGQQSLGSVNVMRIAALDVGSTDVDITVDVATPGQALGAPITQWVCARYADASNFYVARFTRLTAGPLALAIYRMAGGVLTGLSGVATPYWSVPMWRLRLRVNGSLLQAKAWPQAGAEPLDWTVETTDTVLTVGTSIALASRLESGNTNPLPVLTSWDNLTYSRSARFSGYVSEWPTRWDLSGKDVTAPIRADGILRRLGQGTPSRRSSIARAILGGPSVAYWPCEDGVTATQIGSALADQPSMTASGTVTPGVDATVAGSGALPTLAAGASLYGTVSSYAGGWNAMALLRLPTTVAAEMVLLQVELSDSTIRTWRLILTPGSPDTLYARAYGANGAEIASDSPAVPIAVSTGVWAMMTLGVHSSVPNLGWALSLRQADGSGPSTTNTIAGSTGIVRSVRLVAPVDNTGVGHVAVLGSPTAEFSDNLVKSLSGYDGELATVRLARLCAEDGVPLAIATADVDTPMGPQQRDTPVGLYRSCEAADGGLLYERGFGLGYLPRSARYNPPVTLALDKALGQLGGAPQPTDDDQRLCNRWTVTRTGGSSATVQDTANIAANGLYAGEVELCLHEDAQCADHARWRLHLGTVAELRWPSLPINLAASPGLIPSWLQCDIGSRVTVAHMSDEATYDDPDVLIEGGTEVVTPYMWAADLITSPTHPWQVFAVGSSRVGLSGKTLAADVTSGGTTLSVGTADGYPPLTTTVGDMPFDVGITGEQITFTAVTKAASDTFGRTVASGWGSADSGQSWVCTGGSASDYSVIVSGYGRAQQSHSATATIHASVLDLGTADVDYTADAMLGVATATGASITQWVCGRYTDASNYYVARLDLQTTGRMLLSLYKRVGGALNGLGSGVDVGAQGASHWWRVRLQVAGSSIQAKAWDLTAGAFEPSWQVSATDTALTTGTGVALLSRLETGNADTLPLIVSWDNLSVTSPQTVTVTRSVNGVTKAHSAGDQVLLWQPPVIAL